MTIFSDGIPSYLNKQICRTFLISRHGTKHRIICQTIYSIRHRVAVFDADGTALNEEMQRTANTSLTHKQF